MMTSLQGILMVVTAKAATSIADSAPAVGLGLTRELAELCHASPGKNLLDVASGTRETARYLAESRTGFGADLFILKLEIQAW